MNVASFFLPPLASQITLTSSGAVSKKDSYKTIPRYLPLLILYQAITSDVIQPHQKFKINLESLVFLQPEEKIKVRSRLKKEDRSQE